MGDKGTQQFIPGVAPSAPLIIKPNEVPNFEGITEVTQGDRKQTSKRAAAAKKKKRKSAKKSRKNNR